MNGKIKTDKSHDSPALPAFACRFSCGLSIGFHIAGYGRGNLFRHAFRASVPNFLRVKKSFLSCKEIFISMQRNISLHENNSSERGEF